MFLRTHYYCEQLVKSATRNCAILDKMGSNMLPIYGFPSAIGELGTSDHKMVLLVAPFNEYMLSVQDYRVTAQLNHGSQKASAT